MSGGGGEAPLYAPPARRFRSYADYFRELFGGRIQKVTINAGFTCPNRDGGAGFGNRIASQSAGRPEGGQGGLEAFSVGGCTFCSNDAFTPSYCTPSKSVTRQIDEGIEFHARRYRKAERYLAYFQSFSNTYAPLERLREIYGEALAHPLVAGIVVGTRPDCIDEAKLDYFAQIARKHYVAIEYGVESTCDATLRAVNRGHDFACARRAIEMTDARQIPVGAHFILGLPGETDEMLLAQAATINSLPLTTVKFHQLQIFRGTPMAREFTDHPERFNFRPMGEYLDFFIEILRRLRPSLVIERFAGEAPPRHRLNPDWGAVRNTELATLLDRRLAELDVRQGDLLA